MNRFRHVGDRYSVFAAMASAGIDDRDNSNGVSTPTIWRWQVVNRLMALGYVATLNKREKSLLLSNGILLLRFTP